ncbi:hypothetical protein CBG46_10320 [Actinobacillus succinogenes]|uniref:Regulatory protein LacI n=1 Tax=Actinobacillus succinogenes (strain ATCC 55618 / DSM 22257 / CCUG 43843 / 130Z) TaxID=339671 RepID=A6VNI4_ACTSZ|nr:LacI family DNA-binding transcriptional regulator [Actinobacillus succinogenes]ABR74531.1 regulatory protein LacI [Actinobacillus succinogenes 130Z]PHI41048.1 hypothetical protein CBG46_10320 [Actinobacillus succinogenes]
MREKHKKASINDVAKLAKVGKASVSRYLNGKFDILSDEIQTRIKSAITELGYQPSLMARSIKKGNSKLIALIVADITNAYSIEVMQGIEYACRKNGYTLLVFNAGNDVNLEEDILSSLIGYQVEGAIVHTTASHYNDFIKFPFPLVFLDRKIDNFKADIVGLDNTRAMDEIMSHLYSQGFERFLFITEPIGDLLSRKERAVGFWRKIEMNETVTGELFEITDEPELENCVCRFMRSSPTAPKAIITANSSVTLTVSQTLRRLNVVWGKDVGLVGVDDPKWTEIAGVGISALRQPTFELGRTAFQLLYERLHNPNHHIKEIYYSGELIIRKSTSYLQGK